jgi:hypothetical protein
LQLFKNESSQEKDLIENRDIFIKEKSGNFLDYINGYVSDALGPFKYRTIAENVPSFLFEIFDEWFEDLNKYYMSELNKSKATLMQTQENY